MDAPRTSWLEARVDPEQDFHRFGPIGAVGGSVQEPHVELDVRPVVGGQFLDIGSRIIKWFDHRGHFSRPRYRIAGRGTGSRAVADCENRTDEGQVFPGSLWASLIVVAMNKQHSLSAFGRQENYSGRFKCPSDLIARSLVDLELAFGLEAFKRCQ